MSRNLTGDGDISKLGIVRNVFGLCFYNDSKINCFLLLSSALSVGNEITPYSNDDCMVVARN